MTREDVMPVAYRVKTFARLIEASGSGVRELIVSGAICSLKVGVLLRITASELGSFCVLGGYRPGLGESG